MKYPNINAEIARVGMTKTDFAQKIGVSYYTFKSWQAGKSEIPATKLMKMADIFGCTTDYLLGYRPPTKSA